MVAIRTTLVDPGKMLDTHARYDDRNKCDIPLPTLPAVLEAPDGGLPPLLPQLLLLVLPSAFGHVAASVPALGLRMAQKEHPRQRQLGQLSAFSGFEKTDRPGL